MKLYSKKMVYEKSDQMLSIYLKHLFDSDYLVWIYKNDAFFDYKIIQKFNTDVIIFDKNKISFTKANIEEWNESNTIKYEGISLGEFQVHRNRSCFKFRFNFLNLIKLYKKIIKNIDNK